MILPVFRQFRMKLRQWIHLGPYFVKIFELPHLKFDSVTLLTEHHILQMKALEMLTFGPFNRMSLKIFLLLNFFFNEILSIII